MLSFSSAGITLSYWASALRQSMLLYSFACYTSAFQWAWAVKDVPSLVNPTPSNGAAPLQLPLSLAPAEGEREGPQEEKRGKAFLASHPLCEQGDPPKESCPRQPVFPLCPAACVPRLLGTRSSPSAGCSSSHLLFPFCPCRFTPSSVPQPRASGQFALTCPQTRPLSSSDSPASVASKPNMGCDYLKTALWFHHPFIHLGYKNNTLFYLWV